jgi:hypothetical protein
MMVYRYRYTHSFGATRHCIMMIERKATYVQFLQ